MKMLVFFVFCLLISNYGFCYYLNADMRGQFSQQVVGNGSEEGITILIAYQYQGNTSPVNPLVNVPNNFNYSECQIRDIELVGTSFDSTYLFHITVSLDTQNAKGGCHIIFGHPFLRMMLGNLTYKYNKSFIF